MALLLADSFNRTNSTTTLGSTDGAGSNDPAAWSAQSGTWGINSNKGYLATVPGTERSAAVDCGGADIVMDIDVTLSTVTARAGIIFRSADDSNYWLVHLLHGTDPSDLRNEASLYSKIAGSYSLVDGPYLSGAVVLGHTYHVQVVADGASIAVSLDGTPTFSYGVSTALDAFTKVGLYVNAYNTAIGDDGASRFDNLTVNGISHGGWVIGEQRW